jgi:hypothetical protein
VVRVERQERSVIPFSKAPQPIGVVNVKVVVIALSAAAMFKTGIVLLEVAFGCKTIDLPDRTKAIIAKRELILSPAMMTEG